MSATGFVLGRRFGLRRPWIPATSTLASPDTGRKRGSPVSRRAFQGDFTAVITRGLCSRSRWHFLEPANRSSQAARGVWPQECEVD